MEKETKVKDNTKMNNETTPKDEMEMKNKPEKENHQMMSGSYARFGGDGRRLRRS